MFKEFLNIFGITEPYMYPNHICSCQTVTICETDNLIIPCTKPDIGAILDLFVTISISRIKLISSPSGEKTIVYAMKHFKVLYEAVTLEQSVHAAHFNIPFCFCFHDVARPTEAFIAVEDIAINLSDCRSFNTSLFLVGIPMSCSCSCYTPLHNTCYHESHISCEDLHEETNEIGIHNETFINSGNPDYLYESLFDEEHHEHHETCQRSNFDHNICSKTLEVSHTPLDATKPPDPVDRKKKKRKPKRNPPKLKTAPNTLNTLYINPSALK